MVFIEVLHIKTQICPRIPISKDRLAIVTNYSSITKDRALEETVLTLFHPVVHACFQLVSVTIEGTIAHHDVVTKTNTQSVVGLAGLVHTK